MASSSSSTAFRVGQKYDVFVSFRGEDIRNNFLSFLRKELHEAGIQVFNDEGLNRGEEIPKSLMNAIEDSNIYVIIFSEGYASSRWCLEELLKIIECKETYSKIVLPVFFLVDPSDVRNQTGPFGFGFIKLLRSFSKEKIEGLQLTEEEFEVKVKAWRNAMKEAANLSGYPATHETPQPSLTQKIRNHIIGILNCMSSADNKDLVGIQPIVDYIIRVLLHHDDMQKSARVGIWGMGGIGKTTVAEVVFNEIKNDFEAFYFARNIRERSSDPNMLALLQQDILSKTLKDQDSNINSTFTKRRLGQIRVLIVFDDVTHINQIEYLIRDIHCLGAGSQIIITSRDKQVLKTCGVDEHDIYKLEGLSPYDARKLFYKCAFRQDHPKEDYYELSNSVVEYAKGVPLALKVLGFSLFDKPKEVWKCAISKLEIIPDADIYKVLKVSYDGLDDIQQNIFLDIACFLKWEDVDFVKTFLDACEFYAEKGISDLVDKCLVSISNDNKITMHDLLQEMGWEIVRTESINNPGERTRLWHYKDSYNVLEQNIGTRNIQGICLDMSKLESDIDLQPSALGEMCRLRFLKLHDSQTEENNIKKVLAPRGLDFISDKLTYLCWHGCPLKSWVSSFRPRNLIELHMPHSNIEQLWPNVKLQLKLLKHIDLSYSKHLKSLELSLFPNLESLILEGCASLVKISSSIHCLNYKLVFLNLRHCKSLQCLPSGIHSKSLREVSGIHSKPLRKVFLSRFFNMKKPSVAKMTEVEEQSISMEMKSLEYLNLSGCIKLDGFLDNFGNLEALKELNLTNCCIKQLPHNLGRLSSLESLLLGSNNFESIPTSIMNLRNLSYLDISYCQRVQTLPILPSSLERIDAHNCRSLEGPPTFTNESSGINVNFINCFKLAKPQVYQKMEEYLQCQFGFTEEIQIPRRIACICFPGNNFPCRLSDISLKPSISTKQSGYDFIWCAVVKFQNYKNKGQKLALGFDCTVSRQDEDVEVQGCKWRIWGTDTAGPDFVHSEHVFMGRFHTRFLCERITINFSVEDLNGDAVDFCRVIGCGVLFPFDYKH